MILKPLSSIKIFIKIISVLPVFALFALFSSTSNADDAFFDDNDSFETEEAFWDPIEPFNRVSFSIMKVANNFVIMPVATVYDVIIPNALHPHMNSLTGNAKLPLSSFNSMLLPHKTNAFHGFSKLFFNTVFGMFGFFDYHSQYSTTHTPLNLDDITQYYAKKPLPYLVLPMTFGNVFTSVDFSQRIAYNNMLIIPEHEEVVTAFNFGSMLTSVHANKSQINDTLNNYADAYPILRSFYYQLQKGKLDKIRNVNPTHTPYKSLISGDFQF